MIYSKRRKSVGGGRRKHSNRMSYMSKRTKSSVIRIKQMGGAADYIFTTTRWHADNLLKELNDNQ